MATRPQVSPAAAPVRTVSRAEQPPPERDRVLGMYPDEETADRGVQALLDASFAPERIEVIELSRGHAEAVPVVYRSRAPQVAADGAAVGAVAAGIVAALLARDVLTVPGLELTSGHPLAVALQAAFGGLLLGGVAGTLIGLYGWKREPAFEEADVQDGFVLVGVPAVDRARRAEARQALERTGALSVRA